VIGSRIGSTDGQRQLNALKGKRRVWIVLSGSTDVEDVERKGLLAKLDAMGRLQESFRAGSGAAAAVLYLYDFSRG
jgi:hypothetical protein